MIKIKIIKINLWFFEKSGGFLFFYKNFYNANTESEQINTICELNQLLDDCI